MINYIHFLLNAIFYTVSVALYNFILNIYLLLFSYKLINDLKACLNNSLFDMIILVKCLT